MGTHNRSTAVLLVTDQASAATETMAAGLSAEPVLLAELTAAHLDSNPSVIFDVDLRQVDTVRRLKSTLPPRGDACRIFLIDVENRVTAVHANVLGADRLLPRQASVAEMHAALDKHFNRHLTTPEQEMMLMSIDAGVEALDSSFVTMLQGGCLDTEGVIRACQQIANAVCVMGICAWMTTVRTHHEGTFQHCMLVTGIAAAFATKTGMSREDVVRVTVAGLLHDIGKADVPLAVLDKPGALTLREMDMIRLHPQAGYDYLVRHSTVEPDILGAVRHHHEYLDGSGYPSRLAGDEINAMTRIITVVDVYAALIERRSYKAPKSHAEAIAILDGMAAAGKLEARLVREMDRIMAPA